MMRNFVLSNPPQGLINAKVAQLVERDLAKVEVAGSNPVFRSSKKDLTTSKVLFYFAGDLPPDQDGKDHERSGFSVDDATGKILRASLF
jgi:hypothetical protein